MKAQCPNKLIETTVVTGVWSFCRSTKILIVINQHGNYCSKKSGGYFLSLTAINLAGVNIDTFGWRAFSLWSLCCGYIQTRL
jgi:hypothetical protein